MRILITRPADAAADFAVALHALGHETICASLLTVHFPAGPELDLQGVAAVAVTSANGVRALARRSPRRDVLMAAVGPQTAEAAKLAGYARIECAHGDAEALAAALPQWVKPGDGLVMHAAGADAGRALAENLAAAGYQVRREVLYEVRSASVLPSPAAQALAQRTLDAAFFFSPKSARAFRNAATHAGLASVCASLAAICISAATADALCPLHFRNVRIAEKPNRAALLEALSMEASG
jgi:uroporphyrinogen-III synthase